MAAAAAGSSSYAAAASLWRTAAGSVSADLGRASLLQMMARATRWSHPSDLQQQQQQQRGATSSAATPAPAAATPAPAAAAPQQQRQPQQQPAPAGGGGGSLPLLESVQTGLRSEALGPEHAGLYYTFDRARVPEAFQPFHQQFYAPRPPKLQRKGGCRGLQAEFAASGCSALMWRRSTAALAAALDAGAAARVHLTGPAGAGKSVALAQLVEWARGRGWLALYVPSAAALVRGGFFAARGGGAGGYDTIVSAQHTLKSAADAHGAALAALPLRLPASWELLLSASAAASGGSTSANTGNGGSVGDLVAAGLSTDDDAALAVDACLALVAELAASAAGPASPPGDSSSSRGDGAAAAAAAPPRVLLAVDDYNALAWRTDYGYTRRVPPARGRPGYQHRVELSADDLNLARGLKLLLRGGGSGSGGDGGSSSGDGLGPNVRVVVADTASGGVPPTVAAPGAGAPGVAAFAVPRLSEVEVAHALWFYHERGVAPAPPTAEQVASMAALTRGSGAELRRWAVSLSQTDIGLL